MQLGDFMRIGWIVLLMAGTAMGQITPGGGGTTPGNAVTSVNGQTGPAVNLTPQNVGANPIGAPSVIIAASNTPNTLKVYATVTCTGTADQTCINNAITTYCPASNISTNVPGCYVMLLPGIFQTTGSVIIDNDDVTLAGMNYSMWGGYLGAWNGTSSPSGAISYGNPQIRAMAGGFNLIDIQHYNLGGNGGDTFRHRGIVISNLNIVGHNFDNTWGIVDSSSVGDDLMQIVNNSIMNTVGGMLVNFDTGLVENNSVQSVSDQGIAVQGINVRVIKNIVADNGGICMLSSALDAVFQNNTMADCPIGIQLYSGANFNKIEANTFEAILQNSVNLQSAVGTLISGNTFDQYSTRFGYSSRLPTNYDVIYADANSNNTVVSANVIATQLTEGGYAINYTTSTGGMNVANKIIGAWNNGGASINGSWTSGAIISPSVSVAQIIPTGSAPTIASASTIAPASSLFSISGTAAISTITLQSGWTFGCYDILATGAWTTVTGGNIAAAMTAVSGVSYRACNFGDNLWRLK